MGGFEVSPWPYLQNKICEMRLDSSTTRDLGQVGFDKQEWVGKNHESGESQSPLARVLKE